MSPSSIFVSDVIVKQTLKVFENSFLKNGILWFWSILSYKVTLFKIWNPDSVRVKQLFWNKAKLNILIKIQVEIQDKSYHNFLRNYLTIVNRVFLKSFDFESFSTFWILARFCSVGDYRENLRREIF